MSQEYDILRTALLNKQSCFAVYDGYRRYFCPHIVGWKAGVEQALCWQYAGESSRPLPLGGQWKCFTVANMSDLATIDDGWHDGEPGHTGRSSTCVDIVDAEIQL